LLGLLRRKFEADTKGEAIFPLAVLSALYFFDEFDTAAFGTLAPEIQKSFHLSDERFLTLIILNVSVTVLLAVPLGYWADRTNRTRLVWISGMIAGTFSLGTGMAVGVLWLTFARFGNGVGLLANIPVHNSLVADYYTPDARPTAFANHANALQVANVIAPALAGGIAVLLGWRAAFFILFVPIIVTSFVAMRLKEPARGATDAGHGELPELALPPKFLAASKTLWNIKTLRRSFMAAIFVGAGFIPLVAYLALYFEREFGLDAFQRGMFGSASAVFAYLGIQAGGKATPGWFAKGMGVPVQKIGMFLSVGGVGLLLIAVAPTLWLAVPLAFATNYVFSYFTAPLAAVQALVSPARERSLAFSFGAIFLVLGVVLFFALGLGSLADDHGLRWAIGSLSPFWFIGGLIAVSAAKFVEGDVQAAMLLSVAEAEAARAEYESRKNANEEEDPAPA
jgi:MFS family permease